MEWLLVVVFLVVLAFIPRLFRKYEKFDFNKPNAFFVTGCASGIGKEAAFSLLSRGQKVIATDINFEGLQQAAKEFSDKLKRNLEDNLLLLKLDVTDPKQWEDCYSKGIAKFGVISVHLNIAGYLKPGYCTDFAYSEVHRHLDINTKGMIFGVQVAAKHMKEQRKGHIVNIGSLASLCPYKGCSLYGTSKTAIRFFSLAADEELRPKYNIAVTLVCPDAVKTPMYDLEIDYEEASYTFSAPALTAKEVVDTILDKVLTEKPNEIYIPTTRGYLMHFGNLTYGTWLYHTIDKLVYSQGVAGRQKAMQEKKKK